MAKYRVGIVHGWVIRAQGAVEDFFRNVWIKSRRIDMDKVKSAMGFVLACVFIAFLYFLLIFVWGVW